MMILKIVDFVSKIFINKIMNFDDDSTNFSNFSNSSTFELFILNFNFSK